MNDEERIIAYNKLDNDLRSLRNTMSVTSQLLLGDNRLLATLILDLHKRLKILEAGVINDK